MGYGKLRQATGTTTLVVKFYADKAVFSTKRDDKDFLSATARAASTSLYKMASFKETIGFILLWRDIGVMKNSVLLLLCPPHSHDPQDLVLA